MAITAAIHREALTEREEDAQRRLDFAAFAQQCFRELNPLTPLAMNWHVEVMTAKLAAESEAAIGAAWVERERYCCSRGQLRPILDSKSVR